MQKVVKPKVVCEHCGSVLKCEEYADFCDYCKKKYENGRRIVIDIFWKGEADCRTNEQCFCSMSCARKWVLNFPYNKERVRFLTLPFIHTFEELDEFLGRKTDDESS